MNQIPSEGEFCGDCPCTAVDCCALYDILWEQDVPEGRRLPICIKERPQIVKGEGGVVMKRSPIMEVAMRIARSIYQAYKKESDEDCGGLLVEWIEEAFYGILVQQKLPVFYHIWNKLIARGYTQKNPLVYGDIDVSTWAERSGNKKVVVYIRHCSMADDNTLIFIMDDYQHLKTQDTILSVDSLLTFRVVTAWPRQLGYPRRWGKEWKHRVRVPSYWTYRKKGYTFGYGDIRDKGHVLVYSGMTKRVEAAHQTSPRILHFLRVLSDIKQALKEDAEEKDHV